MMERFTTPGYALGLLGLAMAVIPLNDALIKILSAYISLGQVVAVRAMLSLVLVVIVSDGPSIPNLIATCPVLEFGIN